MDRLREYDDMEHLHQNRKVLDVRGTGIIDTLACRLRVFHESIDGFMKRRVETRRGSEKVDALTAYRDWIVPKSYKPVVGIRTVKGLFMCLNLTVSFLPLETTVVCYVVKDIV